MSRKRQVILYLVLVAALFFSFMRLNKYYFTPEEVLYACERGLRYGPSTEIAAELSLDEGETLLVGIWEGNLSTIPVKRAYGLLWKMSTRSGGGLFPCEKTVDGNIVEDAEGGRLIGLVKDPAIEEVFCIVEYVYNQEPVRREERTMAVGENGFFTAQVEDTLAIEEENVYGNVDYWEGRGENGEVLFRWGRDGKGNLYYDEE